jgi:hypothetical protein
MVALLLVLTGCSPGASEPELGTDRGAAPAPATATPSPPPTPSSASPPSQRATRSPGPVLRFDTAAVRQDIHRLAVDIGPREATSPAFARAADLVERRLQAGGYLVHRTRFRVPAGSSWGVPVRAGTSVNVVARPEGFDLRRPHVVIGAHLDTVAVSPGAEDNASGVAVLLELARLAALSPPEVPVVFVAFGAEEPRGSGDRLHHFGSRREVAGLSAAELAAVRAMVSLDRVGVRADAVPVCSGGPDGTRLVADLRAAGRRAGVPTSACTNRSSDHWSYEKAGVPAARLGSVPYAGYHSRRDVMSVVDDRQLGRVGRLMWRWLRGLE